MTSKKYGANDTFDLSDWGRPIARIIAKILKDKPISVIQVTNIHFLMTLLGALLILQGQIVIACLLLVVKGIVDAVDGELARLRDRPSHVGRFWDTIADTIGLVAVIFAFGERFDWGIVITLGIVFAILLQYSLFNHFSVRLRTLSSGDTTSRVDESKCPTAYPWEKQKNVVIFHRIYVLLFSWQDRIVRSLTGHGSRKLRVELTSSSILGYGFQSIILVSIALFERVDLLPMIVLGFNNLIFIFTILYSRLARTTLQ